MAQCIGLLMFVVVMVAMIWKDCHCLQPSAEQERATQSMPFKDLPSDKAFPNSMTKEVDAQRMPRKFLQGGVSSADAKRNPERLVPSGPSDPKQYKNTITQECRKQFDLNAPPPVEPDREVPTGPEDPRMYDRLKGSLACRKAMKPHHKVYSEKSPANSALTSLVSEPSNIQPERNVPTGPDPIHHKSTPQAGSGAVNP